MLKKVGYFTKKGERWKWVMDCVLTTPEECDICQATKNFIEHTLDDCPPEYLTNTKKSIGRAKANLKKHLASGRHIKYIYNSQRFFRKVRGKWKQKPLNE